MRVRAQFQKTALALLTALSITEWGCRKIAKVSLKFEGAIAFIKTTMPQTGRPLVWAIFPKADDNSRGNLNVVGACPPRTLPGHYAFIVLRSKNIVTEGFRDCSQPRSASGDNRVLLSLSGNTADAPGREDKKGHDIEISPLTGRFREGPVVLDDGGSVIEFKKLGFSGGGQKIRAALLGDRRGINGDDVVARIALTQGKIQPGKKLPGKFGFGFYDSSTGKLMDSGLPEVGVLAQSMTVTLSYAEEPLSLKLQLLGMGGQKAPSTQTFLLCPAQGEKSIDIELFNLPLPDELGVPAPAIPGSTFLVADHFGIFYDLVIQRPARPLVPMAKDNCPNCGGMPFCTHALLEP